MGRGSAKRKRVQNQIAALEIKKRNGMMRAIVSFVGLFVIIALKLSFQDSVEWLQTSYANFALFCLAVAAAAVAGTGTRAWTKSRKAIDELKLKLK